MKGFTLVEVSVTILLLMFIFVIVLNFNIFNKDFLYLKEFSRQLNSAFVIAGFLAQQTKSYGTEIICALGVYFPNNNSYETLAFTTSTLACDYVINNNLQNFLNSNISAKKYVHSNLEIRSSPLSGFVLKNQLKRGSIVFSTNENCNSDLNPPLLFLFVYSYVDIYFLYQQTGVGWQKIDNPSLFLCLNFRNDQIKIKINKVGQFYIMQ